MFKVFQKKAFASIAEVVITAIVFSLSAVGILTVISSVRPKGSGSARDLEAAYLAKQQVEYLRGQVHANLWEFNPDSNILADTPYSYSIPTPSGIYTVSWRLTDVPAMVDSGVSYLRELDVNVSY